MTQPQTTINYLPSWYAAEAAELAARLDVQEGDFTPLRTMNEDGTIHFSELKKIALSGKQYLHAVNTPFEPTSAMLLGTLVHFLVLGARPGAKPIIKYNAPARSGNAWKDFKAANEGAEILTAPEWAEGEAIARALLRDPVAIGRLAGARLEMPLAWEEGGMKFSTSGIDIVPARMLGDLKTTTTTQPEAWARQAFKMNYPQQLVFYRRGARAHGIDTSEGLFLLGVETKAPYEVVDLELTEGMIDFAEKTVSLWLEKLRANLAACPRPMSVHDWPGYAQTSVPLDVPSWVQDEDEEAA